MPVRAETIERLDRIPNVAVFPGALLSHHTRFGIGGPAGVLAEAGSEASFVEVLKLARETGTACTVIGDGTNLIVSDRGFPGIVLRLITREITRDGSRIRADAGAELQTLVDYSISQGLRGLDTMTGIPGSVGAAVYGNAGAYGHSIDERVREVRFFDGSAVRAIGPEDCQFHYRESIFKPRKDWIVFSVALGLEPAPAEELRKSANDILKIRLEKYPPAMKCAGSIFKNLILADLPEAVRQQIPERVVREGKAPSAYFLEQAGAKGMRLGGIQVADYHANLIYNTGDGNARELRLLIGELKSRVRKRFGLELQEEVQYVGFSENGLAG